MRPVLFLAAWLSSLLPAAATSFRPAEHTCPVCDHKSMTADLASYSNFGEPARDLSDNPIFAFASVELCPADLFATWKNRWRPLKPAEKQRLAEFLKAPAVILTAEEREIVKGHEAELPQSPWWERWWARSCDSQREPSLRHQWFTTMDLHFAGQLPLAEEWQEKLAAYYREQAIRGLEAAVRTDWASAEEKRVFPYLRAELIRRAGRKDEAKALFAEVIASEKKQAAKEETAWIAQWAAEQSLRIDVEPMATADLATWLLPAMPDPWRDMRDSEPPGWAKHRLALVELSARARRQDAAAGEILWKALDRKPARLLALAETLSGGALGLRELGEKWDKWFAGIEATLNSGKLPDFGREEPNDVRVQNVLGPAIAKDRKSAEWNERVFKPAIKKALETGGLPEAGFGGDPLLEQLRLYFETAPPEQRLDFARLIFRVLKTSKEDRDIAYEVLFMADDLAKLRDPAGVLRAELEGKWESSFWKAVCSYIVDAPGSEASLLKHPRLQADGSPNEGPPRHEIVWDMLEERHSAAWKSRALDHIAKAQFLESHVLSYAIALEDKDLTEALKQRAARLRKTDPKEEAADLYIGEADDIETAFARQRLARIPLKP